MLRYLSMSYTRNERRITLASTLYLIASFPSQWTESGVTRIALYVRMFVLYVSQSQSNLRENRERDICNFYPLLNLSWNAIQWPIAFRSDLNPETFFPKGVLFKTKLNSPDADHSLVFLPASNGLLSTERTYSSCRRWSHHECGKWGLIGDIMVVRTVFMRRISSLQPTFGKTKKGWRKIMLHIFLSI